MTFVRTLLVALMLPALLLPEGARLCLHELLCRAAPSDCGCRESAPAPIRKACCVKCEKPLAPDSAPRVAATDAACCVKVPPSQRVAPTIAVERAAIDHALTPAPAPIAAPIAWPFDAHGAFEPPLARAAAPPRPSATPRFLDASVSPPLRL
jgi:hypothetical protein